MGYTKEISQIVLNKLINAEEIFNYFNTPLESHCNKIYLYYKNLIETNSDLYKIEPNYFYYNNKTTVNASAQIKGNSTLISINIGTINKLKNTFLDNEELVEKIFGEQTQKLNQVFIEKNSSVMEFMYYSAIIFLLNHEIAHLIQHNGELEKKLNELIEENKDFKIENHIYEVDSDIFASMKLTHDIYHVWQKFDDQFQTDEFLFDLISLAASAIGIFKLFNLNAKKEIYYREKSHPHVAIRYILIQEVIVDFISHMRKSKISNKFKDSMMSNSFSIIDSLNKYHKDTFFDNFAQTCIKNSEEIMKYGTFLITEISKNERCAYYKFKSIEK